MGDCKQGHMLIEVAIDHNPPTLVSPYQERILEIFHSWHLVGGRVRSRTPSLVDFLFACCFAAQGKLKPPSL